MGKIKVFYLENKLYSVFSLKKILSNVFVSNIVLY